MERDARFWLSYLHENHADCVCLTLLLTSCSFEKQATEETSKPGDGVAFETEEAVMPPDAPAEIPEQLANEATFDDRTASAVEEDGRTAVLLAQDGKEIVVEESRHDPENPVGGFLFRNLAFSPRGRFLVYEAWGWEWSGGRVYDTQAQKNVLEFAPPSYYGFTPDEQFFYACGISHLGGEFIAAVYASPDFSVRFDALAQRAPSTLIEDFRCSYDAKKQVVRFVFDPVEQLMSDETVQDPPPEVIEMRFDEDSPRS